MLSIFVGTSSVRYSDIGGQASVIQKLKEAVEWALRHPEVFQRIDLKLQRKFQSMDRRDAVKLSLPELVHVKAVSILLPSKDSKY